MTDLNTNPRPGAIAATLLLALGGAVLFRWIGSPLPWMIGPLVVCAAVNIATGRLVGPRPVRQFGQWIIGLALGLYFTADVLGQLARIGWLVALGVAWAIALGVLLGGLMRRLAGIDARTAFFAAAIGGATEMTIQAERVGGHGPSVAAAHAVRIMLVVLTIPFLYRWLDLHGSDPYHPAALGVDPPRLAWLLAATGVAGACFGRLRIPNGWVMGPLFVSALLTGVGWAGSAVPDALSAAAQVAIGLSLGTRFTPAFVHSALRVVLASLAVTLVALLACGAFGWALGAASGLAPATLVLATSPGGIAEMSLTARTLELGVPIVVAFQVTRMVAVLLTIGTIYRLTVGRRAGPAVADPP